MMKFLMMYKTLKHRYERLEELRKRYTAKRYQDTFEYAKELIPFFGETAFIHFHTNVNDPNDFYVGFEVDEIRYSIKKEDPIKLSKPDRISWEKYALELAKTASIRSEDPYVKVGCCILRKNHTVAGVGYNGAPTGINIDFSNREERRPRVIHAEMNALKHTSGDLHLAATTLFPCIDCFKQMVNYGIKKIVYSQRTDTKEYNSELVERLAVEWGIDLVQIKD